MPKLIRTKVGPTPLSLYLTSDGSVFSIQHGKLCAYDQDRPSGTGIGAIGTVDDQANMVTLYPDKHDWYREINGVLEKYERKFKVSTTIELLEEWK